MSETRLTSVKRAGWNMLNEAYNPMSVLQWLVNEGQQEVLREGGNKTRLGRVTIIIEVEGIIYES